MQPRLGQPGERHPGDFDDVPHVAVEESPIVGRGGFPVGNLAASPPRMLSREFETLSSRQNGAERLVPGRSVQCRGTNTTNGERCGNQTLNASGFCDVHSYQSNQTHGSNKMRTVPRPPVMPPPVQLFQDSGTTTRMIGASSPFGTTMRYTLPTNPSSSGNVADDQINQAI